jgi:hypothetical protein
MNRDVVLAIVGASAALAGLVLVFLGILVTSYQALLGRVSERTLGRFRVATWLSFALFAFALLTLGMGVVWLDAGGGDTFYMVVIAFFFAELISLSLAALYVTWRVLLRG